MNGSKHFSTPGHGQDWSPNGKPKRKPPISNIAPGDIWATLNFQKRVRSIIKGSFKPTAEHKGGGHLKICRSTVVCIDLSKTNLKKNNFPHASVAYTGTNMFQSTPKLYNWSSNLTQYNTLLPSLKLFQFKFFQGVGFWRGPSSTGLPTWQLTYPLPRHFWRWFSFSQEKDFWCFLKTLVCLSGFQVRHVSALCITEWLLIHYILATWYYCACSNATAVPLQQVFLEIRIKCFPCGQANPSKVLGPNYNRISYNIYNRYEGIWLVPLTFWNSARTGFTNWKKTCQWLPVHQISTK